MWRKNDEIAIKICRIQKWKKRPTSKGTIPVYGGNGILDYTNTANMQSGVVIGRVGVYCGSVFLVREECWVSDNAIKAMCKENMDLGYLYYLLSSLHLNERRIGTSQPLLTQNILNNIEVEIPELAIQKRISSILELFDEKIKLNNKINNNLEQQIRTLCNAWLNEYVPFGGSCPNDWELTPLASFAKFISGYSYKGGELKESTTAMATIKNFDRKGGFKLDGYKEIIPSSKLKPEHHVELFDTLVAHTDLTQNAEVIGNAEPVLSFSGYNDIIFSMDIVKVIPDNPAISKFLIAAILQTQQFKSHCLGYVNGTTVLHLSKRALPEYSLRLPRDLKVLQPLDDAVSSMYQQIALNIDESVQLATLRDSLLTKLMSGELDVSNIDL